MYKKITGLLLLLLPFSVLSEPLITCEPEGPFDTYFLPALGFGVLLLILCRATSELFNDAGKFRPSKGPWIIVVCVNAVVIGLSILLVSYTLHLVPDKKQVINKDVLMSVPDVSKGFHYQNDCLLVSKDDNSVALSCKPDATTEIVPLTDYSSAIKALTAAENLVRELQWNTRNKNICRPGNSSSFSDLFPDL
ncbi:hypothetical protein K3G69_26520 [Phytobacter diazotrophicus]|uniref:hypothetical protein n=1 Tax=Phytobacter diazotrophicus TaxID=395631 RepID=UPI001C995B6E|nr:hypothetical protein [Phytobacter diazotrophicus]MBY6260033.1 hypothetical protein [Phytobacter diazotrophicus]